MMVKMQFGINRHSKTFDGIGTCNRGFVQLVLETKQFGFSREGNNSGLVNVKLRADRNARSTN
jgi:hypothetical protein